MASSAQRGGVGRRPGHERVVQLFFDLASGNPVARRIASRNDDYEEFVGNFWMAFDSPVADIGATVQREEDSWSLTLSGWGSSTLPGTVTFRPTGNPSQWPLEEIAK